MINLPKTNQLMRDAVVDGVFPSGSLLVAKDNEVVYKDYFGSCSEDTIFDVASLTKPIVTTTLAIKAIEENILSLEDPVTKFFPEADHLSEATIFNLLNHSAGFPRWKPYFQELPHEDVASSAGKDHILTEVLNEPLEYKTGTKGNYDDLGFILLGEILEKVFSKPLFRITDDIICKPIGMNNSFYRVIDKTPWSTNKFEPVFTNQERDFSGLEFAPTEDCPWRGSVVRGYVHDQNCYAMGGAAGHAGFFSTIEDINKFVLKFVGSTHGKNNFLKKEVVDQFVCLGSDTVEPRYRGTFLLGWDRPEHPISQSGNSFSRVSIGHLGYTGCSLWIDLKRNFWVILLTNRVHPSATNQKIKAFRPVLHDKIVEELGV